MNPIDERRAFHRECPNCEHEALEVCIAGGSSWNEEIEETIRYTLWQISCPSCKSEYLEEMIG